MIKRATASSLANNCQVICCLLLSAFFLLHTVSVKAGALEYLFENSAHKTTAGNSDDLTAKAAAGDMESRYQLGVRYYFSEQTPEDKVTGRQWLNLAAEQGHPHAQSFMGFLYQEGYAGLPKDRQKSIFWYRKAADGGDHRARLQLGALYTQDKRTDAEFAEGVGWYESYILNSPRSGGTATHNLAAAYDKRGGHENHKFAYMWYSIACPELTGPKLAYIGRQCKEDMRRVAQGLTETEKAEMAEAAEPWAETLRKARETK